MRFRALPLHLAAIALLALAGCAPPPAEEAVVEDVDSIPPPPYSDATMPQHSPPSAGIPGNPAELNRPASRRDIVLVEGMPDTVEMHLVRAPEGFPLVFSTYAPADMVVQADSSDAGHSLEFVARFGGVLNERAYVQFFFYPAGTALASARSLVETFVAGLNPELDLSREATPRTWMTERSAFTYPHEEETFVGSIGLAQRGNVVFHYLEHYPAEYGDGMAPRIGTILDEWRWGDGTSLTQ